MLAVCPQSVGQEVEADKALWMATTSLDKMASGGMYDHIGGGFHRYSVDELWHVPHFEKMLYDHPQLANVYLQVCCHWQLSRHFFCRALIPRR